MNREDLGENVLLRFKKLTKEGGVFHAISTRQGGVSQPPYDTLNLGFHNRDEYRDVLRNRVILSRNIGSPLENFIFAQQVHSGNVATISEADKGKGVDSYNTGLPQTDAMITNVPGITLMVLVADCGLVLFFDRKRRVIGIAHSGRLGVANEIAIQTIKRMKQEYHCQPEEILVGLGPMICGKHYPISEDNAFMLKSILQNDTRSLQFTKGRITFDLSIAIKEQLLSVGIIEQHIEQLNLCTYEESKMFFSERRDGPPTGRFGAVIYLK